MALARALVGRTYEADAPFDVSRQKIREFADAIGDEDPIYRDVALARAAGHPDVPAPPTFVTIPSLDMGLRARFDPELGLDYARVVHGEQRIDLLRPVFAGDVLDGTVRIAGIRDAGANELLTIECDLAAEDRLVARVTSVLVSRGTAEGAGDA